MEPVQVPRVFSNRYELTHLIARGGMAQVYRARDRLLDRPVAIKVLFPELSVDRAFVERFRREAQAAANLSHPNIVPVFDWGEDGGTYFIVMEFIDGQPLSAVLRATGPMPADRVADIGSHVAAALAYAHRHGVVHRDVKPGNVLITDDGLVKVTDFGIARAVNTEESLTQTGAVMGTATYFSPEQAEGIGVDSRSDIYSLGVVLYEMVAGRPPFLGESPVAVASKHVRDQPPALSELAPTVPADLEAVIMKAMAKSPDRRYASADDLRADLLRFADHRPVSASNLVATTAAAAAATSAMEPVGSTRAVPVAPEDEVPPEEEGSRTAWLVALLIVLAVALGIIAYFLVSELGNSSFAMPNVVHQPVATATTVLQEKGLVVEPSVDRTSAEAKGTVLDSTPKATASVKKGDKVVLTVSSGPAPVQKVVVPTVVGSSLASAEAALENTHLKSKVTFVSSNKPATTVISQTPGKGHDVPLGSTVLLTVPKSSSTVGVPNVVGLSPTQAKGALASSTLTTGTVGSACSNSFGKGLVSGSTPPTGTQVAKASPVALTVSSGPCQAPVPNVTGSSLAIATSTLTQQGFAHVSSTTTTSCTPKTRGAVVKQTPTAGTTVPTSTQIVLGICSAVPTTSTTTSSTTTSTTPSTTTTTSSPPHTTKP
ncbi:MAG: Stk1 family PASTA domain-containing Ser/Thr kinase [Acidimicrobiales bacterium]